MESTRITLRGTHRGGWLHIDYDGASDPGPRRSDALFERSLPEGAVPTGGTLELDGGDVLVNTGAAAVRTALREWRRWLAPGGEVTFELPDMGAALAALLDPCTSDHDAAETTLRAREGAPLWTIARIERILDEAGFDGSRARARNGRLQIRAFVSLGTNAESDAVVKPTTRGGAATKNAGLGYARPMSTRVTNSTAASSRTTNAQPMATRPASASTANSVTANSVTANSVTANSASAISVAFDSSAASDASAIAPLDRAAASVADTAPTRVLVWCAAGEDAHLVDLFTRYGRVFTGRPDLELLCVFDGRAVTKEAFAAAASRAFGQVLGEAHDLRLACVALPEDQEGLDALCDAATVRIASDDEPLQLAVMDLAGHVDPARLARAVQGGITAPQGAPFDSSIAKAAADLHPWFYPVELAGHRVVPGLGSPCAPQYLESRTAHRRQMLVDAVLERVDMKGRRVLDLACNCAYWTSAWAQAGASELFGLEGRPEHVAQARLHWSSNGFLPEGAWRFEQGDIANSADWKKIRDAGPFDVTLCAGILYHVRNYEEILRWAAVQTREVLVVDTRVQDGDEILIDEPGDLRFNAIESTRRKVVPNRARLVAVLEELGLSCEVLDVPFSAALGVDHDDDYAAGRRVTIVARKVRSALPSARVGASSTGL